MYVLCLPIRDTKLFCKNAEAVLLDNYRTFAAKYCKLLSRRLWKSFRVTDYIEAFAFSQVGRSTQLLLYARHSYTLPQNIIMFFRTYYHHSRKLHFVSDRFAFIFSLSSFGNFLEQTSACSPRDTKLFCKNVAVLLDCFPARPSDDHNKTDKYF